MDVLEQISVIMVNFVLFNVITLQKCTVVDNGTTKLESKQLPILAYQ